MFHPEKPRQNEPTDSPPAEFTALINDPSSLSELPDVDTALEFFRPIFEGFDQLSPEDVTTLAQTIATYRPDVISPLGWFTDQVIESLTPQYPCLPNWFYQQIVYFYEAHRLELLTGQAYQPFKPQEEISHLHLSAEEKSLPPSQRRLLKKTKVDQFHQALQIQQASIAQVIIEIYQTIEADSDLDPETLLAIVYRLAPQGRFDLVLITRFQIAIETYFKRRRQVDEYKRRRLTNGQFFLECFGFLPDGRLRIITTDTTIHFCCARHSDFIAAYFNDERLKGSPPLILSAGAAFSITPGRTDLEGIITVQSGFNPDPQTIEHERHHQLHRLVPDYLLLEELPNQNNFPDLKTPKGKWAALEQIITHFRHHILDSRIRTEILASHLHRDRPDRICWNIRKDITNHRVGHFRLKPETLTYLRDRVISYCDIWCPELTPLISQLINDHSEDGFEDGLSDLIHSVYVHDTIASLPHWLEAITILREKGYPKPYILAYLFQAMPHQWPSLARRAPLYSS